MHAFAGKRRLPRAITATFAGMATALFFLLRREDRTVVFAYGEGLLIVSLVYFLAAWVAYLKRDGIGFLNSKFFSKVLRSAESWKDRIPSLGEAPPLPEVPPVSPEGLKGEEIERLRAAEENLRKRISGEAQEAEDPEILRRRSVAFSKDAMISGFIMFALSMLFQYLLV